MPRTDITITLSVDNADLPDVQNAYTEQAKEMFGLDADATPTNGQLVSALKRDVLNRVKIRVKNWREANVGSSDPDVTES